MHDMDWVGFKSRQRSGGSFSGKNFHNEAIAAKMRRHVVRLACVLLLLTAPWARAQVLYGSLTGGVTDSSGAVVVGAKVTALEVQTGVSQAATTDSSGIYRFSALTPGTYKVTISAAGFAVQETPNVQINGGDVVRIPAVLQVGSAAQNVTVTTEAPLLQTDKADVHTDITSQQIENLPIMGSQGRNFQGLLRVIPGVGLTAETNSLAGNPQRAINANVNGQSNQTVNTRIDGAQNAYPWLPANVAYVPPADAIETVNVSTNSFDAEQGMAGGAAVNVQINVTRRQKAPLQIDDRVRMCRCRGGRTDRLDALPFHDDRAGGQQAVFQNEGSARKEQRRH